MFNPASVKDYKLWKSDFSRDLVFVFCFNLQPLPALQTFYRNRSDFIRRAQHADAPTQSDETRIQSSVGVEHCSTLLQLRITNLGSPTFRETWSSCFASTLNLKLHFKPLLALLLQPLPALQTCSLFLYPRPYHSNHLPAFLVNNPSSSATCTRMSG